MTKYDREFLVPYLQNICALHLLDRKLSGKTRELNRKMRELENQRGYDNPLPTPPEKMQVITIGRVISFAIGAYIAYGGITMMLIEAVVLALVLFATATPFIGGAIWCAKRAIDWNELAPRRYQMEMEGYENVEKMNRANMQRIQTLKMRLQTDWDKCAGESNLVNATLQRAYSTNIIPYQYRNIYAAIFLYDWFSTSRADDLDMALNMFVLEEIKSKLDRIIENQSEMILNQCMMLANQERSLEEQQRHDELVAQRLDQIATSSEERNTYLSMIESNSAVTAYFATAEYIRHL